MIPQGASNRRSAKPSPKVFAQKISSRKEPTWFQRSKWAPRSGQTWIADQEANNSEFKNSRSQEFKNGAMRNSARDSFFLDSRILEFLNSELLLLRHVCHSRQHRPR